MANIRINSAGIMAKLIAYTKTEAFKTKFRKYRDGIIKGGYNGGIGSGIGKIDGSGGVILSQDGMMDVAYKMIDTLRSTASDSYYSIPRSVMRHIDNMEVTRPVKISDDEYSVGVYFDDDLSRKSLLKRDGSRTGEGIDNIVALLNVGYHASDSVYGIWEGHGPVPIDSLEFRSSTWFMQAAVEDFNGNYGSEYNVLAKLSDEYT